ncbi:MAG: DUF302 domain-containing protein [Candidatus Hodarchaeales archaeon]|jgi:uncharacterized protein (DUF302 family)
MFDITKPVNLSFEAAYDKTVAALKDQGFGVLTEINVKETFKKKLDVDFDKYVILGACNPSFAHKALEHKREIGLLLPCNICIWEKDGRVTISAIDPEALFNAFIKDKLLHDIAKEVKKRISTAIDSI